MRLNFWSTSNVNFNWVFEYNQQKRREIILNKYQRFRSDTITSSNFLYSMLVVCFILIVPFQVTSSSSFCFPFQHSFWRWKQVIWKVCKEAVNEIVKKFRLKCNSSQTLSMFFLKIFMHSFFQNQLGSSFFHQNGFLMHKAWIRILIKFCCFFVYYYVLTPWSSSRTTAKMNSNLLFLITTVTSENITRKS